MCLLDIATEISHALGDGWTAEPGRHDEYFGHAVVRHRDGRAVDIRSGDTSHRRSDHGRLFLRGIHGDLATHRTGDRPGGEITVAATRAPADIAGEITRRLLPGYTTGLRLCRARDHDHRAALARRSATVDHLRRILPSVWSVGEDRVEPGHTGDPVSGTVHVLLYGGDARISLRVTASHVTDAAAAITAATTSSRASTQAPRR
ncbi:hypothetical protein [Nocardia wallacei]|uniref:hypothetical protein n=1 Tax=Nocardia wallacei TaxID=480035 RepID=UPI002456D7BC|nr:hypothetical protein [Nocardia wallacei]